MPLALNSRLGRYEIRSKLGEGGMGEVYRAHDPKLGRDVAVKVLPAAFSADAERLRRFEQEARAAGALNHPNVIAIYDVETHDGAPFVVSELLEGHTLREQLRGAPLPRRKALDYAVQIAAGLAAAHERGIVHRDLKPENLFVTTDGRVKILDFGIAKLVEPANDAEDLTDMPTRRLNTDPGVVIGTAGYMSPEQVRGGRVDHRSDIFSFGCVLYEMLSGRGAFRKGSTADTISAVLNEDPPDISETNGAIPPALERLVRRCLEKNPAARFHSAGDLAFALEALSGSGISSGRGEAALDLPPPRSKNRERLAWIMSAILLLSTLAFAALYFRRAPAERPAAARFLIYPPEKAYFGGPVAVSPDGRRVVLRVISEGKVLLWVRALDSLTMQPLAGTEEGSYPFWSPDGRSVGFFSGGKLKKIEVGGGPAQTLCDAPEPRGGAWNAEGVIVFAPKFSDALYRVPAAGGAPAPLTALDASRKEYAHYYPRFLPDGRHFLYLSRSPQRESAGIYVGSLDSKETKLLVNTNASAEYASPGYLLFLRERTLLAQAFDADRLELRGDPSPVAERVDVLGQGSYYALFSASQTGVLVYRGGSSEDTQLTWFDRGGKQLGAVGAPGAYSNPWLSPDEKLLAVSRNDPQGGGDLWLIELGPRGATKRFTFDPAFDGSPTWSPDGGRIVFNSDRDGPFNLYQKAASGAGQDELLLKSDNMKFPTDWSADGRFILYQEDDPETSRDLWVLPLSGGQAPFLFLRTGADERQARFSPDGKWIAYTSNESGSYQVYVQSFPASGGKWQVSTNGGAQPQWRGDGRELFYVSLGRRLMAVEVKGDGPTFAAGVPQELFELRLQTVGLPGPRNFYAAATDGRRFLVASAPEERITMPTAVVLNWTTDLKR